jgi:hypothetical protein
MTPAQDPLAALASLGIAVTLGYAALCAASPFGRCRRCRGFGYRIRTDRGGHLRPGRYCRRCRGVGYRIRFGRHLFNLFTRASRGRR